MLKSRGINLEPSGRHDSIAQKMDKSLQQRRRSRTRLVLYIVPSSLKPCHGEIAKHPSDWGCMRFDPLEKRIGAEN